MRIKQKKWTTVSFTKESKKIRITFFELLYLIVFNQFNINKGKYKGTLIKFLWNQIIKNILNKFENIKKTSHNTIKFN